MKYSEIITIDGKQLTKKYIQSLTGDEREKLVPAIFNQFREVGCIYPDEPRDQLIKEYKRLQDFVPDLEMSWYEHL